MASCDLVRVIRQQVDATGSVAATHVEQLLALVERLEGERQREHDAVLQAQLERNTYRALIAAHDALITTHTEVAKEYAQTEAALQATEARFQAVFDGAAIGIVLVDGMGRIIESNPAFLSMLGYHGNELRGMVFTAITHPDDVQTDLSLARELFARQRDAYQIEKRYVRKDGQIMWGRLTVSLIRRAHAEPQLGVGMVEDITVRKQMEDGLRFLADVSKLLASSLDYPTTLQRVARLAVPFLADACIVDLINTDRQVQRLALAHRDPAKEHVLQTLHDRYPLAEHRPDPLMQVLETGQPLLIAEVSDTLLAAVALDAEQRASLQAFGFTSAIIVPLRARERLLGSMLLISDESGRRYGELDLTLASELATHVAFAVDNARLYTEAQQALEARDEFLAFAVHELRTPVVAFRSATERLQHWARHEPTDHEREQRMVDGLAASALHLDRVIAMLGDLAQIQIGHVHLDPQPLDLGQVTQQVVAELEPALSQHPLDVSLPAEPVLLLGDEVQIARVIHNLLENAMKYSPQGGPIWLQLEQGTDQVVLTITDQGIGIPEADQPQVFNRFYRASNTHAANTSGLGIGLYLVNEVVTRHGGTVEVCSTAGEGSTFTIRFPLTDTAATLPDQQARGDGGQTGPAHADGAEHTPKAAP